jgi:hypothetical protein
MPADFSFTHLDGPRPPLYGTAVREIPPSEGQTGHLFKVLGTRGTPASIHAVALLADATAWANFNTALQAAVGTEKNIEFTADGSFSLDCVILAVAPDRPVARQALVAGSASANTYLWSGTLDIVVTA